MKNYKPKFYGVKSWAQIQYLGKLKEAIPENLLVAFYKVVELQSRQHYLSAFSTEKGKIIHITGHGNTEHPIILKKEIILPQTILYNAMATILHQPNNNKVEIALLLKEVCEKILSPLGVECHWTVFSSPSNGRIMVQIGSYKEIEKAREHQKKAQKLFNKLKSENNNIPDISNIKTIFDPLGSGQDRIYFIQPTIFYQNTPIEKIS